jgi:hypothetical protein
LENIGTDDGGREDVAGSGSESSASVPLWAVGGNGGGLENIGTAGCATGGGFGNFGVAASDWDS